MTINVRILASLVRITDAATTTKLAAYMRFEVRSLHKGAVAHQLFGKSGLGIAVDETWLAEATDETLDQVMAQELVHVAYGPGGESVKWVLGSFARMKPQFVPKEAREDYNAATDAIIEHEICRTGR